MQLERPHPRPPSAAPPGSRAASARRALRFAAVALVAASAAAAQPPATQRVIPVPEVDWGAEELPVRAFAQRQTLPRFQVFHDFRFTDRRQASGIEFRHRSTSDSGKYYQPNHYDHGNGVVVADVDGDRLLDVYFVNQLGPSALYRNLGGGRFRDVTAEAGVGLADRLKATAAFADVDGDGDPDLYVTTVRMGNALFLNDGAGRFREAAAESGLAYSGHSSGATFFDYDADGALDLFLANVGDYTTDIRTAEGYYMGRGAWVPSGPELWRINAFFGHLHDELTEQSILYRGTGGGRFEDVSAATGLRDASWSGDAAFADVDGDGRPDLYVVNMQGNDTYWQNVGGRTFADRTAEVFPRTPWGAMGIKFFDFDNDGDQDLLVTDMHSDMFRDVTPGFEKLKALVELPDHELEGGADNIFGNALYENLGGGRWREVSDQRGVENYWPWGPSIGDLNADGWEDVFIASGMNFPFRYGINSLLLNNQGREFLDAEFLVGVEPRSGLPQPPPGERPRPGGAPTKHPWFELDCAAADREHPLCANRSGRFTVLGNVGTRSAVLFDLDQDGDLDIVTNEFNDRPQVLVSDLAERRPIRWLQVKLRGTTSNRDGLGARVEVHAGGRVLARVHDGKSGYLSQSSMPLYFGLGDATRIERVRVRWPSGRSQEVTDVAIGTTVEVVER
jgi:hypothetical protein